MFIEGRETSVYLVEGWLQIEGRVRPCQEGL